MHLISTKHTQSAFRMLYRFINLLKKRSILVINFLFLGIYSFLIYANVNKLSLLVTYSIILGISFLYFIVYLVNEFFVHNNVKNKIIGKICSYLEKSRYISDGNIDTITTSSVNESLISNTETRKFILY